VSGEKKSLFKTERQTPTGTLRENAEGDGILKDKSQRNNHRRKKSQKRQNKSGVHIGGGGKHQGDPKKDWEGEAKEVIEFFLDGKR